MWRTVKLQDVCEKITDGSHFSPKTVDDGYAYITVRDINNDRINFNDCKYVAEDSFLELQRNGCAPTKGDVLFSKDGTVGKVALVSSNQKFVVLSSLAIISPKRDMISSEFLFYVMKSPSFVAEAIGRKTGVAIRRIILKNLKKIDFQLPSLAEQQRIVAKLDGAFAEIDNQIRYTEMRVEEISTLQNLFNNNLVQYYLEKFPNRYLDALGDFKNGLNYRKSEKGYTVNILGVGDFQNHFYVEGGWLEQIQLSNQVSSDYLLKDGDILFVRSNGNKELIGRSVLVRNVQEPTSFSGFTIRCRLKDTQISPEYVCHILKSNIVRSKLVAGGGGSNISSLNQKMLAEIVIPIADKLEQLEFLERMNAYSILFQEGLEASMKKIGLLKSLKSAILAQELQPSEAA